MNIRRNDTLPAYLHSAYNWIASAGEWDEAVKTPEQYAHTAYLNAVENEQFDVLEDDLVDVITWYIKNNGIC